MLGGVGVWFVGDPFPGEEVPLYSLMSLMKNGYWILLNAFSVFMIVSL